MTKTRLACVLLLAGSVLFGLRCGEDKGPGPEPQLIIIPDSLTIEVSSSHTFEVAYGDQTPDVMWYVDGTAGGDPWKGMITTHGLYVAPDSVPAGAGFESGFVTLEARVIDAVAVRAEAKIFVTKTDVTPFVRVIPDTATVLVTDSLRFFSEVAGCFSDDVTWSIEPIVGDPDSVGTMRGNGTYVAPVVVESTFDLMVRATSIGCPSKSGVAKLLVAGVATPFDVELEDYTDYLNLGVREIFVAYCGAASKEHAVEGLDVSGEYVEVPVRVPGSGTYVASVWYSTSVGTSTDVRVTMTGISGMPQEEDFVLDQGTGIG